MKLPSLNSFESVGPWPANQHTPILANCVHRTAHLGVIAADHLPELAWTARAIVHQTRWPCLSVPIGGSDAVVYARPRSYRQAAPDILAIGLQPLVPLGLFWQLEALQNLRFLATGPPFGLHVPEGQLMRFPPCAKTASPTPDTKSNIRAVASVVILHMGVFPMLEGLSVTDNCLGHCGDHE